MSGGRDSRTFEDERFRAEYRGEGFHTEYSGEVPRAYTPDDRTYMILMYQEHAQLARQQEMLRTFWILGMLAIAAPLGLYGLAAGRLWQVGGMLCALAILAMLALTKHEARYRLHSRVMRAFRRELAETVRPDIAGLTTTARLQHDRGHRVASWIGLSAIFLLAALGVLVGGAAMIWFGVEKTTPTHAVPPPAGEPGMFGPELSAAPLRGPPLQP